MSACDRIRPELKAYTDGQVSALSRLTIRWHLAHCADCRGEVEEMQRISNQLREEEEALAPALRARILAALPDGLPEAPEQPYLRPRRQQTLWIVSGLAAAALVMVLFLPRMALFGGSETSPIQESAMQSAAKSAAAPSSAGAAAPLADKREYLTLKAKGAAGAPPARNEEQQTAMHPAPQGSKLSSEKTPSSPPVPDFDTHSRSSAGGSFGGGMPGNAQAQPASPQKSRAPLPPADSPAALSSTAAPPPVNTPASPSRAAKPGPAGPSHYVRSIHYDASLTLLVADLSAQSTEIERIGKAAGGSVSTKNAEGASSREITLTIPSTRFESVRKEIARLGEVQGEKVSSKDLTEQIQAQEKESREDPEDNKRQKDVAGAGKADRSQPVSPKGATGLARKEPESKTSLEALRQSANQATLTIHLTLKPK